MLVLNTSLTHVTLDHSTPALPTHREMKIIDLQLYKSVSPLSLVFLYFRHVAAQQ